MKRLFSFFLSAVMMFCFISFSSSEDVSVSSYNFDLFMHLNIDAFPDDMRSRMEGYAELINMLEFKGNLTFAGDNHSFDLNLEIIPVTNPDASLSFRFFGLPEFVGVSSDLFGEETIWLNNLLLMEFSYKTWNNLQIPLQYIALLYPYVYRSAFAKMASAWKKGIGSPDCDTVISSQSIQGVSSSWSDILQNDSRLIYWIAAVSALSDDHGAMESEFAALPDYLLHRVAEDEDLIVSFDDSSEEWKNRNQEVLFFRTQTENETSWRLTLPETESGYLPRLSFSSVTSEQAVTLKLDGSYRQSDPDQSSRKDGLPVSLLDFSFSVDSFPAVWPCDCSFSAGLYLDSMILPQFYFLCKGSGSEDGAFSVHLLKPSETEASDRTILTCSGTVVPVNASSVPDYSLSELRSHESVFTINDKTMDEFIRRIRRPLFLGLLDFLNEVPPGACRNIMDDLEDYGVLNMLSGE